MRLYVDNDCMYIIDYDEIKFQILRLNVFGASLSINEIDAFILIKK